MIRGFLAIGLALAAAACGGARDPGTGTGSAAVPGIALVVLPAGAPAPAPGDPAGGRTAVARVEVAADPASREHGLMGRDILPPDTGMLFAYGGDRSLGFWMKNCRSPLAAAFMDREGRILNIEEMAPGDGLPEEDLPRYFSRGAARYVLEMEGGWFARKGIRPGDRADLSAALRGVEAR